MLVRVRAFRHDTDVVTVRLVAGAGVMQRAEVVQREGAQAAQKVGRGVWGQVRVVVRIVWLK